MATSHSPARIAVAEGIGTAVLLMGGVGTAVLAGEAMGTLGIALAFGLSLLVMAATIGHVSGCHINPAVTVGLYLARKIDTALLGWYLLGQVVGALVGAGIVWLVASGVDGFSSAGNFAANGYGELSPGGYGLVAVLVAEVAFTALFVLVVLATTRPTYPPSLGPLAAGLGLTLVHLATIPVSNTSVNPARSLAAAVFAGGDALAQLWVFILAPVVGGALAAVLWRLLGPRVDDDEVVTAG
ncbi:aquaporin [Salsipaludibacter albus]|uniref:aquaporin n=1 Tax=Salsipaludibacter albus TaxID=2849650 RepID=UPI001EE49E7F|nr:aquaporin [Salsipaludibacter albus]MBY5163532.1 aquaporin [Salsipaludibacter albus]